MFNLIMRSVELNTGRENMPVGRIFEYTDDRLIDKFRQNKNGPILLDELRLLPCLFMQEGEGDEVAYVGQITVARISGGDIVFEYTFDPDVPPLRNNFIYANRMLLDMAHSFEFSRNHWAVKDIDLYQFLLRNMRPRRQRPTVFQISEHENIEPTLVSAMMPFDEKFNKVYGCIRSASDNMGLRCRRADDIWENAAIIQDVVSLIDRSRIVICDCTGRNQNVFYEAGIAHTLGREVILITQNEYDIPFDLRHLRYVKYLDNEEGRTQLREALEARMQTLLGH